MSKFIKDKNLTNGKGENDDIEWITVNGAHIPISENENINQIFNKLDKNSNKHKNIVDFVDRTSKKAVQLSIDKYCKYLSNQKEEHCILIDKEGNIWDIKGNVTFVQMPEEAKLDGAIAMHNHLESHSFSKEDITMILENKNTECVLVDPNYIYIAKGLKELNTPYNYYYQQGCDAVYKDGLDASEINHFALEEMKKDGLIEYERRNKKHN